MIVTRRDSRTEGSREMRTGMVERIVMMAGTAVMAVSASLAAAGPVSAAPDPKPTPYIIGGSPASTLDFPFTVALGSKSSMSPEDPSGQFCGGTLVAPTKVVTAAHCVDGENVKDVRVIGGRDDLRTTKGLVRAVSSIWIHPDRPSPAPAGSPADVAVLTMREPLPYRTIEMVSAKDSGIYQTDTPTRILGWGDTDNGYPSPRLMTAQIPVADQQKCKQAYGSVFDPAAYVCAGYWPGGVNVCFGDSGGPLIINGRLAGITSWGRGCATAGYPANFTKLTAYADAVQKQIQRP